jgi:hypothetical protein
LNADRAPQLKVSVGLLSQLMEKTMRTSWTIIFLVPLLLVLAACSASSKKCLGADIQQDISDNPELTRADILVEVIDVRNGYITLDLKKGFSTETRLAIFQGKALQDIQRSTDPSVRSLLDLEEVVKKRPKVKAISWTAEGWTGGDVGKGVPFQSLPGRSTTRFGESSSAADDPEANCVK